MSEHQKLDRAVDAVANDRDEVADAIAAIAVVAIFVASILYWVSHH